MNRRKLLSSIPLVMGLSGCVSKSGSRAEDYSYDITQEVEYRGDDIIVVVNGDLHYPYNNPDPVLMEVSLKDTDGHIDSGVVRVDMNYGGGIYEFSITFIVEQDVSLIKANARVFEVLSDA